MEAPPSRRRGPTILSCSRNSACKGCLRISPRPAPGTSGRRNWALPTRRDGLKCWRLSVINWQPHRRRVPAFQIRLTSLFDPTSLAFRVSTLLNQDLMPTLHPKYSWRELVDLYRLTQPARNPERRCKESMTMCGVPGSSGPAGGSLAG
jgi:hypothetical protein